MPDELLNRLMGAAEMQNKRHRRTSATDRQVTARTDGKRPGDLFNMNGPDWAGILTPHGWKLITTHGETAYWRRPGKEEGVSATTGHCKNERGEQLLYVFSTNATPLEAGATYSKFSAYTVLNHAGDYQAAARKLADAGYGEPTETYKINHGDSVPVNGKPPIFNTKQFGEDPEFWLHDDLMNTRFSPQPWLVEGLIMDESLTILGGMQKLGKSWLCLQLAQAVAGGKSFFGKNAEQGEVIYLAIEDGARRLQDRLRKQATSLGLPIVWYTKFPKLDDGGLPILMELCSRRPRLLVIDTLAAAKSGKVDEQSSGPMGDLGNMLRQLAQHYRLSIVIVHHHGKTVSGDPGHDLRGSSALGAAADVLLGLYRVRRTAEGEMNEEGGMLDPEDGTPPEFWLKGRGRDIEEFSLPITFGVHTTWRWDTAERGTHDKRKHKGQDTQAAIVALLQNGELSEGEIASFLNIDRKAVGRHLTAMVREGILSADPKKSDATGRLVTVYSIRSNND